MWVSSYICGKYLIACCNFNNSTDNYTHFVCIHAYSSHVQKIVFQSLFSMQYLVCSMYNCIYLFFCRIVTGIMDCLSPVYGCIFSPLLSTCIYLSQFTVINDTLIGRCCQYCKVSMIYLDLFLICSFQNLKHRPVIIDRTLFQICSDVCNNVCIKLEIDELKGEYG